MSLARGQQTTGTTARTRTTTRSPVRALFRLMSPAQQQVLFENTSRSIGDAPRDVQIRHIVNCLKADPAYGEGVTDALGIPLSDVPA